MDCAMSLWDWTLVKTGYYISLKLHLVLLMDRTLKVLLEWEMGAHFPSPFVFKLVLVHEFYFLHGCASNNLIMWRSISPVRPVPWQNQCLNLTLSKKSWEMSVRPFTTTNLRAGSAFMWEVFHVCSTSKIAKFIIPSTWFCQLPWRRIVADLFKTIVFA